MRRSASRRTLWSTAAATVALVVGGLVFARGSTEDDGAVRPSESSDAVTVPSSALPAIAADATPGATTGSTVEGSPVAVEPVGLAAWLDELTAAGETFVQFDPGYDTTARVVQGVENGATGVLLDDGTVVSLPDPDMAAWSGVAGFAGHLAVVATDPRSGGFALWLLDPATGSWTSSPLVIEPAQVIRVAPLVVHDDRLIVRVIDMLGEPADASRGLIVSDDLQVDPVADPPVGVPPYFHTVAAGHGLLLGYEHADNELRTPNMWAYDLATDEWEAVPNAPWLPCAADDSCDWTTDLEPDERVIGATSTHLVFEVADQDLALLDPSTMTWTDLGPPPFDLRSHRSFVVDDRTLVALPVGFEDQSSTTLGVLDLTADVWTTEELAAEDISFWWAAVATADTALFGTGEFTTPASPTLAFDLVTRRWRKPTDADRQSWLDTVTGPSMRVDDLLALLR